MRLECPDCHSQTFHVHVPPEHAQKGYRFLFIVCNGCGKPFRIKTRELNDNYVAEAEIEQMKR